MSPLPTFAEFSAAFKCLHHLIGMMPPGADRDSKYAQFDLLIGRFAQIPARIKMQIDADTCTDVGELGDVLRTELIYALDAMG